MRANLVPRAEQWVRYAAADALGSLGAAAATEFVVRRLAELAYSTKTKSVPVKDTAFRAMMQLLPYYRGS